MKNENGYSYTQNKNKMNDQMDEIKQLKGQIASLQATVRQLSSIVQALSPSLLKNSQIDREEIQDNTEMEDDQ
ncbi:hypothetical protein RFI_00385 [Reticulomyxa filosa]|uniref:Uncharacterized protein n=1 Tax=Reticulomyxa filosa TaxID=46433 RepID=X6PG57_RETFI|nr:hypothetical protein RFI_00385 [Reticulomyxa filosa]|eukprot:ETO36677.1 hypothetical protein RFI_00385 [Reticulomyxa filosa]